MKRLALVLAVVGVLVLLAVSVVAAKPPAKCIVTVTGRWSNGVTDSCVLDAAGRCNVEEMFPKARAVAQQQSPRLAEALTGDAAACLTFTVLDIVDSCERVYTPELNTDPDGDSDGTTITVCRP